MFLGGAIDKLIEMRGKRITRLHRFVHGIVHVLALRRMIMFSYLW